MGQTITDVTGDTDLSVAEVITHEQAGMMAHNVGVVITFSDRTEYRLTAHPS